MTRCLIIIATGLLIGCGRVAGSDPPATALPENIQQRAVASRLARLAKIDPVLWVGGQLDNAVNGYDLAQPGNPEVATITQGVSDPQNLAVDRNGTLYVLNAGNGDVTKYPFGHTIPSATLSGLSAPAGVAIDTNGDVYVSNDGTPGSIVKYDRGQTTPSRYIVSKLVPGPNNLSFDSARNLYISDNNRGVFIMKHGTYRIESLHLQGLSTETGGLAVDPLNGNVVVANINTPIQITVYAAGSTMPSYQLSPAINSHGLGFGMLPGKGEVLFAPNYGTQLPVYVFLHDAQQPFEQIATNLHGINGVALKPANVP